MHRLRTLGVMATGLAWSLVARPALAQSVSLPEPPPDAQTTPATEDTPEPFPEPEVSAAVRKLLEQPYLTDAERRTLRLRHGMWEEPDLSDAASRAWAALVRGEFWSDALTGPDAPPLDRAEALILRGDPAGALDILGEATSWRGLRLRGQALTDLGRADQAAEVLAPLVQQVPASPDAPADDTAEGVRGLILLARLTGADARGGVGYQQMLRVLGHARDNVDRQSWSVRLAEANLLYEKDRYPDMGQALEEVLTLNPRCAEAWTLLGRAAVDGFDFPRAERVAARLDLLAGGSSPDGAVIRAAALIRQGEGDAARALLAPWLERFPTSRRLASWHAAALAAAFDFGAADLALRDLDDLAPGYAESYLAVGRAVAGARQYDEAARYLREAAARAPNWSDPVVELGMSEMQAGRIAAAVSALELAVALDRYHVGADNSLKLARELDAYATLTTPHFIIRYKPGLDEVMAREMPAVLERLHARVTGPGPGGIDHQPAQPTVVEVYPDHHWFSVRVTGMPQLHTIAAATGPVIAMEAPRDGPGHKAGVYDWARVVQHEFTHTVTLSRTRNRLPHWFTEAGAVFLEDAPRDYPTVQLLARSWDRDELFNLDAINVGFVRPRRPSDRALAYAQGHWMYEYMLARWGNQAPLDLMDLYAAGVREEAAFQQVLGLGRDQFLTEFKVWAGEQLEAWGMRETPALPSVATLIDQEPQDQRPSEPTPELIARWLDEHPDNPAVLEAAVMQAQARERGAITPRDVPLCERYARARPVDPRPHKLLASHYLGEGQDAARAIPHLEWLDAREQHSPGYAIELARLYSTGGDRDRAAAKAARAVQIAPYDPRVREFAATIAIRAGDLATGERHIWALTLIEPEQALHRARLEAIRKMRASEGKE